MLWPIIYSLLMLLMNATLMDPASFLLSENFEEDLKRIAATWSVLLLTVLTPFSLGPPCASKRRGDRLRV